MLTVKKTSRGFVVANFTDRNKQQCSLQESSLASQACIWLGVDKDAEGKEGMRMHLTRDQVAELLPYLYGFVKTGDLQTPIRKTDRPVD